MMVLIGFGMIATFMTLIMTRRLTPMIALIIVPTVFAIALGHGSDVGKMAVDGIKDISPTAALLLFSIAFFAIMLDVGLFDPIVNKIVQFTHSDPLRVTLGTAVLATVTALDGDGSTTFIIVSVAMLPIYKKLGMSAVTLTTIVALIFGSMNIIPWGGPTARAAAALNVDAMKDVFLPMVPALLVCLVICYFFAFRLGLSERKRLAYSADAPVSAGAEERAHLVDGSESVEPQSSNEQVPESSLVDGLDPNRDTLRPRLYWFNALLTLAVIFVLVAFSEQFPLVFVFMVGTAVALAVNFPNVEDQVRVMSNHGKAMINVVSVILAAGVFLGIFKDTGMVEAIAQWIIGITPDSLGGWIAPIVGIISIPLTFLVSNDAFYFSIMPVFAEAGEQYGIPAVDIVRASLVGQPMHIQSPLVPALLLLLSLTGVRMSDHHKKVLWRAGIVCLTMLATGILVGSIGIY